MRAKYHVSILGTKKKEEKMQLMPGADYVFKKEEHLMVIGKKEDVNRILKQI